MDALSANEAKTQFGDMLLVKQRAKVARIGWKTAFKLTT